MNNTNESSHMEQVVRDNLDYLVRFAFFRVQNKSVAEDIVYEAVARVMEHRHPPVRPENMRCYLFRTVYNLCQDSYRSIRSTDIPIDGIDIADEDGEESLDIDEVERINSILDSLPGRQAEVIRMNVVDDLSFVEISRILAVPATTLKSRFKAGMDKIKELYFKNKL